MFCTGLSEATVVKDWRKYTEATDSEVSRGFNAPPPSVNSSTVDPTRNKKLLVAMPLLDPKV